jgi:hypothetical protein
MQENDGKSVPLAIGPRPFFFVNRGDGVVSPLIPADELPFCLNGVDRIMNINDTTGMLNVGTIPRQGTYKLTAMADARLEGGRDIITGGFPAH